MKRIYEKISEFIVFKLLYNTWVYLFLYKSYWNYLLFSKKKNQKKIKKKQKNYLSINVNLRARIGHQLANYNSAIWYAKKFNLIHVHTPFPDIKWEKTLAFNLSPISLKKLIKQGYKKIKLPKFNGKNSLEVSKIKKIIYSYYNQKVIFYLEEDQPWDLNHYKKQYGVSNILQKKFFLSPQRKKDKLIYEKKNFNIAVHIRMGDILLNKKLLEQRYLNIDYFMNTIKNSLSVIKVKKKIKIYIFSEQYVKSFSKLKQFKNIQFCYNLDQYKTFLNFIYADLLIASKSAFSYMPALISKGIKVCPQNFWISFPKNKNWILADSKGKFLRNKR